MYYLVCPLGAVAGTSDLLTYRSEDKLPVGALVRIPFGSRDTYGVVITSTSEPLFVTKPISEVLTPIIPRHLLTLAQWISEYYATRLPVVMQTILPTGIAKNRRAKTTQAQTPHRELSNQPLTAEQSRVITAIRSSTEVTHLLHGVTGSGKTRVYQELAKDSLKAKKSVIVLVPEIALTPQLQAEFHTISKNVIVLHSKLTESERHQKWRLLLENPDTPWVVIGPRSVLFSPLTNLGLIVIDEAHEPSYQQDSNPKYNALRVARKLADLIPGNPTLVLGSATPALIDYFVASEKNSSILTMSSPTKSRNTTIDIVDISDNNAFGANKLFSKKLLSAMNKSIVQNQQILLFHNRRGSARQNLCGNCGWVATCPTCHLPLRLHRDYGKLLCHTCGFIHQLYTLCPECGSSDVYFKGFGSKQIEVEIQKLYPSSTIARFDSDTASADQLHNRYQDLYDNKISIIIGTQGIAKGLDLPHLSTVGIIHADSELFIPDFSSAERSFQLTTQVIGRAGRSGQPATVIIQTLNPEHPAILYAAKQAYINFYTYELGERRAEHMPPYTFLLQLTAGYASVSSAKKSASEMKRQILKTYPDVFVRGPAPAFHEHRGSRYYQQLIVSSHKRPVLVEIAKNLPQRWHFFLDPINLLS